MAWRFLTRIAWLVLAATMLTACGGRGLTWGDSQTPRSASVQKVPASNRHTVRAGDTLYSIAFRYGLNQKQLASWNQLSDATLIYPGQTLRLTPPPAGAQNTQRRAAVTRAPVVPISGWQWPTSGRLVSTFDISGQAARTGILLSGQRGQAIKAALAGKVVYSGSGLKGYGKLIIVQHNESFLSAYGHNAALLVAEGDQVAVGQTIATMGETAAQRPRLHFEIRRNGQPIDPLTLLPNR
ncbi:MAG: peptidoglycan DD-metalloendopeptidase family protein [Pseudomonadota bacterium]